MKTLVLAALFTAIALPVAAHAATSRTDPLEKGQAKVQSKEEVAKSDGKVTSRECAKLAKAQNKPSKKIHNQKHGAQAAKQPAAMLK